MPAGHVLARLRASVLFLGLAAGSLALLALARGLGADAAEGRLGPGAWPTMVLTLLAMLGAGKALAVMRGAPCGSEPIVAHPDPTAAGTGAGQGDARPAILALALFAAYCLALETVGFPVATALLLGGFLAVAGFRRPLPLLLLALGGSVGLFLLFRTVVYVSMPLGAGPFESLSLGLLRLVGAG
jgi:putative tricarboxylic transport membrane protein